MGVGIWVCREEAKEEEGREGWVGMGRREGRGLEGQGEGRCQRRARGVQGLTTRARASGAVVAVAVALTHPASQSNSSDSKGSDSRISDSRSYRSNSSDSHNNSNYNNNYSNSTTSSSTTVSTVSTSACA